MRTFHRKEFRHKRRAHAESIFARSEPAEEFTLAAFGKNAYLIHETAKVALNIAARSSSTQTEPAITRFSPALS